MDLISDGGDVCDALDKFEELRRLLVEVLKKSIAGRSSKEGEFDTSTNTCAPFNTSARP
jgi:hypothetical protein